MMNDTIAPSTVAPMDDRNVITPIRHLEEKKQMFSVKVQSFVLAGAVAAFLGAGGLSFVNSSKNSQMQASASAIAQTQAELGLLSELVKDVVESRSGVFDAQEVKRIGDSLVQKKDRIASLAPSFDASRIASIQQDIVRFSGLAERFAEFSLATFEAYTAATSMTELYEAIEDDLAGSGDAAVRAALQEAKVTAELARSTIARLATDRSLNFNILNTLQANVATLGVLNDRLEQMLSGEAAETLYEGDKLLLTLQLRTSTLSDRLLGDQVYAAFVGGRNIAYVADSISHALLDDLAAYQGKGASALGAVLLGALGFALIGLLLLIIMVRNRIDSRIARLEQRTTDDIIMKLMEEMMPVVADNDYSARLTVTEHVVGTVADSMNRIIESVGEALGQVQSSASEVSENIFKTKKNADEIRGIMEESAIFSKSSREVSERGNKVVVGATETMNEFRAQIQDMSKRLKKLGETTQTIGSVVTTVREIAEKTGILALNASLKATEAGKAGRPFLLIAGEIQKLSESVKESLKDITSNAQAIQGDTNVVISTMEQVTQSVVEGSQKWVKANEALDEISELSRQLEEIISQAEELVEQQNRFADESTASMARLRETTEQFKLTV